MLYMLVRNLSKKYHNLSACILLTMHKDLSRYEWDMPFMQHAFIIRRFYDDSNGYWAILEYLALKQNS